VLALEPGPGLNPSPPPSEVGTNFARCGCFGTMVARAVQRKRRQTAAIFRQHFSRSDVMSVMPTLGVPPWTWAASKPLVAHFSFGRRGVRRVRLDAFSVRSIVADVWTKADELRLSVLMGLRKGLSLVRGMRRSLTENQQRVVAGVTVEHLEQSNWKVEQGPTREGHGRFMPK
jgi:hypothetical protein